MIKNDGKLKCFHCNKLKVANDRNYYINNHPLFKSSDRFELCKDCIRNYLGEKDSDGFTDRFKVLLSLLNRPFIPEMFRRKNGDWGAYIKEISSLPHYKELTFLDSIFSDGAINTNYELDNEYFEHSEELLSELIKYWGRGYTNEEYYYLEEEKSKLMASFECPDYGMEMIMRDICFINLNIEKIRQEQKANGSSAISKLIKTRSDLMNDAKMKPIQMTGSEANDQISFGVLIKKWEDEKPVPKALDSEMKEYIDTYMIGHLAKMEGLNNEFTEKYDQALSKYTISFDEINKQDDYEDD